MDFKLFVKNTIELAKEKTTTFIQDRFPLRKKHYVAGIALDIFCILLVIFVVKPPIQNIISPLAFNRLEPLKEEKSKYEIFGFAPYWNLNKLQNVDFNVLTTLSYFGVDVGGDGELNQDSSGYIQFQSDAATQLFKRAHKYGTRVVLTLTQMNNQDIRSLMDSRDAQVKTINAAVGLVRSRGIDGINVDFEYVGDPGTEYRDKFTHFVKSLTDEMHNQVPSSKVTVSVYASAIKDPKIYDIARVSQHTDGIFMMAYDFAVAGSDNAIPTAPLHGHKEGKYWYDVSTAVDDFLTVMPARKLILGVPWYGYNYPVYTPEVKAEVNPGYYTYYWYRRHQYSQFHSYTASAQTYAGIQETIKNSDSSITDITSGWDQYGQVGWKAYKENGIWRMVFIEDEKSLGIKYDFAKQKGLQGVGMWALGMDGGRSEMWSLLENKFGTKLADSNARNKEIY